MQANIGPADRAIRIIVGIGLLSLTFLLHGPTRWLGLIGIVPLLTALVRFCPLYRILGVSGGPAAKRS